MPLTVNCPQATLSSLFVYHLGLSPSPLTGNIIGRLSYFQFRYLDSLPQLLYVSGSLHILGYAFYVLSYSLLFGGTELILYR